MGRWLKRLGVALLALVVLVIVGIPVEISAMRLLVYCGERLLLETSDASILNPRERRGLLSVHQIWARSRF